MTSVQLHTVLNAKCHESVHCTINSTFEVARYHRDNYLHFVQMPHTVSFHLVIIRYISVELNNIIVGVI